MIQANCKWHFPPMNLAPEPGLELGTLASAFGMLTTRPRLTAQAYVKESL